MVRAGVVGCGRRGLEHARVLQGLEGVHLAGLADTRCDVRRDVQAALHLPTFASLGDLLEAAKPHYVVLATPVHGREALVEQAASFPGVQAILIEKPLALTLAQADRMLAVCAERRVVLAVGHHWRFTSDLAAMKAVIDQGALGRVEFFRGISYGNLLDQGTHLLDAIRWLSGGRRVLWAMTQASDDAHQLTRWEPWRRGYWRDEKHPVPMCMTQHLALEGDVRVALETGLLCPRSDAQIDPWHERRLLAVGTEGIAECRPGHFFRLLSKERCHRQETAGDGLEAATRALHAAIRDALLQRRPYPFAAADALLTLEGMALSAFSARGGGLAAAPLARDLNPFTAWTARPHAVAVQTEAPLRFSVLIPLPVHRGQALNCVRSWIEEQCFPRDRFEVFALADGSEPRLEQQIQGLLGPRDHFLHEAGANRCRLYDLAARQAQGQALVFTESHCVAEPEFLSELDRYFRTTDMDGACCRTIGVSANAFARMDEILHEQGFRQFRQEGDWRKINVHAFALRRAAYLDAGGMDYRYNLFAEMMLAAQLRDRGCRLGYAAAPAVKHYFRTTVSELLPDMAVYIEGESAYRQDHSGPDRIGYTFLQSTWDRGPNASLARMCRGTLIKDALRRLLRGDASGLKAAWSAWRQSLQGGRWERLTAWLSLHWTLARCQSWRWHPRRLDRAYRDAWNAMGRLTRLRFLAEHPAAPSTKTSLATSFSIAEVGDGDLLGFHDLEQWQGRPFRWTGRAALLRLDLTPDKYQVRIDTGNLRQEPVPPKLHVYFNGRRIAARLEQGVISFSLAEEQFAADASQSLVLTCRPLRPWKKGVPDRRELGLPIFHVEFTPASAKQSVAHVKGQAA